jgi:2,3-dihydroxybiphenyl 1,2-dioxygenase
MRIGYFGLEVSSLSDWESFASQVIGLPCDHDADGTLGFQLDNFARRYVVSEGPLDSLSFTGFEFDGREEFESYAARLRRYGVELHEGTPEECARRKVAQFAWFVEPNGLRYEIFHGPELASTPFQSDLIKSRVLTDPELGIGHQLIQTRDLEESEDFYTRVLGFKLISRGNVAKKFDAAFISSSARHHTVAIVKFKPELPVDLPNNLGHLMIEMESMEDVGLTYERAIYHGVTITQGLGRHPDGIFSFYCKTPSGFEYEVGSDAIVIKGENKPVDTFYETTTWGHFAPDGLQLGKPA